MLNVTTTNLRRSALRIAHCSHRARQSGRVNREASERIRTSATGIRNLVLFRLSHGDRRRRVLRLRGGMRLLPPLSGGRSGPASRATANSEDRRHGSGLEVAEEVATAVEEEDARVGNGHSD